MAKATVNKSEQNLDTITSQLLDNPKFGDKLRQGGNVSAEALDMTTRRQLGLNPWDSINLAPHILNQLNSRNVQTSNPNVNPFASIKDVVNGVRKNIKPNVIQTNETINTTAGKGVKKKISQRNLQEIAVRDNAKNIPESIMALLKTLGQAVPLTSPAISQGEQLGVEGATQASSLIETLLRNLQSQIFKPRPTSTEQDVFSAIRSQTGLRPKEAGGSIVRVGNKQYRIDASGRITQVLEPTV